MKFYFDESGRFTVKNPAVHTLVGILYPDYFEEKLSEFYKNFVNSLSTNEFVEGEPKGFALSSDSRVKLFSFLKDNCWLRIAVSLTDSEYNSVSQIQQYRNEQVQIYKDQIDDPAFQSQRTELSKLIDDMEVNNGLNDVLVIKGLLLMNNLRALFIHALQYFTDEIYDDDWKNLEPFFDQQDKNNLTKMERWVLNEFPYLISHYSSIKPITLHPDWYSRKHPFVTNYGDINDDKLLLDSIFKNGFKFLDSKSSFQLQITDWISNTLYRVFKNELTSDFINDISSNLAKNNQAKIHLIAFKNTDQQELCNKYKKYLQ